MLAHSRAYVDELRTRVDEAGSSVGCLTAVDGSEDEMVMVTSSATANGGKTVPGMELLGSGFM